MKYKWTKENSWIFCLRAAHGIVASIYQFKNYYAITYSFLPNKEQEYLTLQQARQEVKSQVLRTNKELGYSGKTIKFEDPEGIF